MFCIGVLHALRQEGDNLLNEDVRNHVSLKKDEVLLPGTSVRLFGSIKLN